MRSRWGWRSGLAVGASVAYFFDPENGRARRDRARRRINATTRRHEHRAMWREDERSATLSPEQDGKTAEELLYASS